MPFSHCSFGPGGRYRCRRTGETVLVKPTKTAAEAARTTVSKERSVTELDTRALSLIAQKRERQNPKNHSLLGYFKNGVFRRFGVDNTHARVIVVHAERIEQNLSLTNYFERQTARARG